jgi:hypothetical protein
MTSDPTVRAVYEDWLLEAGRALPFPCVILGNNEWGDGFGYTNHGDGCGDFGDGCTYDYGGFGDGSFSIRVNPYGGRPSVWRRR